MVLISPLLRELLRCLRRGGASYGEAELGSHVRALMLAELVFLEETALHLPALADRRLRAIQTSLHADPADDTALATWAQQLHLCSRSLARLFLKETGTSFSTWRQHTRLMLALPATGRRRAGDPGGPGPGLCFALGLYPDVSPGTGRLAQRVPRRPGLTPALKVRRRRSSAGCPPPGRSGRGWIRSLRRCCAGPRSAGAARCCVRCCRKTPAPGPGAPTGLRRP